MTFQLCYTYSDDQLDDLRDQFDTDSTSELKDILKKVGKYAALHPEIADQVLEQLEEGDTR
ncbi:hypothetical protein HT576_08655 [Haloterrigena sp. SYSU A121-1]|uniref:Uncharacterized protein n=1 Tax=Haloterrigena gelatinilytica TaxID=2741724 RepID=A0A8J8GMD5_9EURY|nr:hypothetical protein [Haloterrigena gelatinilytica]NUB91089.1 hypothetical protein [Haloterrigena gelatinilytica]